MSLFEGFLGGDRRCFTPYFGFSLFEEIQNAFVRSFLQGECLKSAVLDLPFYCETALGGEVGEGCGDHYDIYHNWFGGSDLYSDNGSHSCFNDCSDNVSVSYISGYPDNVSVSCFNDCCDNASVSRFNDCCDNDPRSRIDYFSDHCFHSRFEDFSDHGSYSTFNDISDHGSDHGRDFVFGGSNGIEKGNMSRNVYEGGDHFGRNYENLSGGEMSFGRTGRDLVSVCGIGEIDLHRNGISVSSDDRSFGTDWAVSGLWSEISSVDGKERFSPSLFLKVYKDTDLRAFSDLLLTGKGFEASLNREGYYGNEVGFTEGYFVFSENGGYAVFGAGVTEPSFGSGKGCKADGGCVSEWGCELGYGYGIGSGYVLEKCFAADDFRYEYEHRFADRHCGCDTEPHFVGYGYGLRAWDRICEKDLFAHIGFILNSGAVRIGKEGLASWDKKSVPEKAGLLFEQGIEGSGFVRGIEGSLLVRGIEGSMLVRGIEGSLLVRGIEGSMLVRGIEGSLLAHGIEGSLSVRGIKGSMLVRGIEGSLLAHGIEGSLLVRGNEGSLSVRGIKGSLLACGIEGSLPVRGTEGPLSAQGIGDFGTGFYGDHRAVLLKNSFDFMRERFGNLRERSDLFGQESDFWQGRSDLFGQGSDFWQKRFDFLQGKYTWFSDPDISGLLAEFQRTALLLENNVRAGIERLGKATENHGADIFPDDGGKITGLEKVGLPLWEYEPVISPEEIRRIRRAVLPDSCAEPVKAEIRVDMSGMKNIIRRETDIDSIVTDLTAAVSEAVAYAAEGVHDL